MTKWTYLWGKATINLKGQEKQVKLFIDESGSDFQGKMTQKSVQSQKVLGTLGQRKAVQML